MLGYSAVETDGDDRLTGRTGSRPSVLAFVGEVWGRIARETIGAKPSAMIQVHLDHRLAHAQPAQRSGVDQPLAIGVRIRFERESAKANVDRPRDQVPRNRSKTGPET